MDSSKFDEAQKLQHKIDACNKLLRVPKQNPILVEIQSHYSTHVFIPADLWDKIMETVTQAKQQYKEEFHAL